MKKGFTLIEILLAVAIIAILFAIVIAAINPARQLGESRNATRERNLNVIADAIYQYAINSQGRFPPALTLEEGEICRTGASDCTGLVDLSVLTDKKKYIVTLPTDPQNQSANGTGYKVRRVNEGEGDRLILRAPLAELGKEVVVVR